MRDFDTLSLFHSSASIFRGKTSFRMKYLVQLHKLHQIIGVRLPPVTRAVRARAPTEMTTSRIFAIGLHEARRGPGVGIESLDAVFDLQKKSERE